MILSQWTRLPLFPRDSVGCSDCCKPQYGAPRCVGWFGMIWERISFYMQTLLDSRIIICYDIEVFPLPGWITRGVNPSMVIMCWQWRGRFSTFSITQIFLKDTNNRKGHRTFLAGQGLEWNSDPDRIRQVQLDVMMGLDSHELTVNDQ